MVNTRPYDSKLVTRAAFKLLEESGSRVDTPLFLDNYKIVDSVMAIPTWASKRVPLRRVVLQDNYTAGSGSFRFAAVDFLNDYSNFLRPGVELGTPGGNGRFVLQAYDPATRIATVTVASGFSDGNLSAGVQLTIVAIEDMTSEAHTGNDISFAGTDYNYKSYFSYKMALANDMKDGVIATDINEFTFEHQLDYQMPSVFENFEYEAFFSPRRAGIGGSATGTPDGTIQGSLGERSGGILPIGRARGLLTYDLANRLPSLSFFNTLANVLRNRGAGRTKSQLTRQYGKANICKFYFDPDLEPTFSSIGDLLANRDVARGVPERNERSIISGEIELIKANGFHFYLCPSTALTGSKMAFCDTTQEDIKIEVFHMMKELSLPVSANIEAKKFTNGFTVKFSRPEIHAEIINIGTV
jgi:hypothetical protein